MRHVQYFTAEWCNPCKQIRPMVNELEKDGLVKFQIIDADDNLDLCRKMGIQGVPTFIIMEDGKEVRRFTGAPLKKQDFLDAINE